MILLDSDVMIDLLRGHDAARDWLVSVADEELAVPGFVSMELIQGCRNAREQQQLRKFFADFSIDWPTSAACDAALETFAREHLRGGIGLLDALIGHTAVALSAPLCTFNQKHYRVVAGLVTLQPYAK